MIGLTLLVQIMPITHINDLVVGTVHDEDWGLDFAYLGDRRTEDAVSDEVLHFRKHHPGPRGEGAHKNDSHTLHPCPQVNRGGCAKGLAVQDDAIWGELELSDHPLVYRRAVSVQVLFTRLVARGQPIASVVVGHDVDSKLRGEPLAKEFVDADVFCIAMAEEEGEARVLVLDVHQRDGASLARRHKRRHLVLAVLCGVRVILQPIQWCSQ